MTIVCLRVGIIMRLVYSTPFGHTECRQMPDVAAAQSLGFLKVQNFVCFSILGICSIG